MTTTLHPTPTARADRPTGRRHPLLRATVATGLVAAAATTALAALLDAAGVPLRVPDGKIPVAAFAQMTFVGAVLGGILVAVLNRRSSAPRRRFVQLAVGLTVLSCIPSVAMPTTVGTALALVATHVLAAAIVVPVLARHADA